MDLPTLTRTLVRRWYVTVAALGIVLVAALVVIGSAQPEYTAARAIVLVRTGLVPPDAPAAAADAAGGDAQDEPIPLNPYTEFTGAVTVTAQVLQEAAQGSEARRTLAQEGLSTDYTVTVGDNAPILQIEAVSDDPDVAITSAERLSELVAADLDARQDRFDVPDDARIVTDDVVVADRTTRLDTARDRALIGVALLGALFVVSSAVAADLLIRSREATRRRQVPGGPVDLDDADEPDGPEDPDRPVVVGGDRGDDPHAGIDGADATGAEANGSARDGRADRTVEQVAP